MITTTGFTVAFELEQELAEQLDRYHQAAAQRARRLADELDRALLVGASLLGPMPRPRRCPIGNGAAEGGRRSEGQNVQR